MRRDDLPLAALLYEYIRDVPSEPMLARFAAETDHPKLPVMDLERARKINLSAFEALWPILAH